MKSILLTTTAIVAFAGAAAADGHAGIGFAGEATLGYNDEIEDGFYWSADIDVTMTAALDNGITATVDFGLGIVDNDSVNTSGNDIDPDDFVLKLAADNASLTFGTVDPVAEANWGGVDGATVADFNDLDTHTAVGFDAMLVAEVTVADITAMASYGVTTEGNTNFVTGEEIDALQLYVSGEFNAISFEVAMQDEFNVDTIFGVSASVSAAGADITAAYIGDGDETSLGLQVAYPVIDGVTVTGYYSLNDLSDDNFGASVDYAVDAISVNAAYDYTGDSESAEYTLEGSYDTGLGATILAGYIYEDLGETAQTYIAGTYDLGGGAELLVSYADDEANAFNDEIGDPEYNAGTTVQVSFSF